MDVNRSVSSCTRVDNISELPDDIIARILSLLPTAEAAATSVVARRWIDLWKYTSKLTFKGRARQKSETCILFRVLNRKTINRLKLYRRERARNINQVNSALKSHKALSLREFNINFFVSKAEQQVVGEWVEFAFSRGVEKLEVNLGWHERLAQSGGAVLNVEMIKSVAAFKSSLKVLRVRCIEVIGDAIELLLRYCQMLERLVITRVRRRSDMKIGGPSLKHLDMRSRCIRERYVPKYVAEDYNIKVCAPNLTWLTIDQNSERVCLDYVPKLVNMNFYCRFRFGDTMHHFAKAAAQLQTLIIHLYEVRATFSLPQMPKLKKLVVYFRGGYPDTIPVTRFLCASPNLEEFKLEISEIHKGEGAPDIFEVPKAGSRCQCGCCPHRHLKLFVLSGYCGVSKRGYFDYSNCEVSLDLVRYVVDNCVVLEEIVIGQCDRVGLVRDIVDYDDESLTEIIIEPQYSGYRHVATPEQRQAFEKIMQMQHIPPHIKLRIVFEIEPRINLSLKKKGRTTH